MKPLPASIRSQLSEQNFGSKDDTIRSELSEEPLADDPEAEVVQRRETDDSDDYEFLDEEENLEDDDVMVGNPNSAGATFSSRQPLKRHPRQKRDIQAEFHVVFRRKDSHLDHQSDYSKFGRWTSPILRHEPRISFIVMESLMRSNSCLYFFYLDSQISWR